jgi:D-threonate/D-erythronate kinase
MLLVLADDFSGAAEIGGVAHRYGLKTEIQLMLNLNSTADIVVFDTNTRSINESEAVMKISEIGRSITKGNKPRRLFKKIDSVMRGHLVPEINALQDQLHFNTVLLLPANPVRGRKIMSGNYLVNGTPIHETVFAHDPDFPVTTSRVASRIAAYPSKLKHVHLSPNKNLPAASIVTGDVTSKADLKMYVALSSDKDLCCGAAELFEAFLENLGYKATGKNPNELLASLPYTLIINGSTVKNLTEMAWYQRYSIPQLPFPGSVKVNNVVFSEEEKSAWYKTIVTTLLTSRSAVITIDQPVQHDKLLSEKFLNYFVELMQYITGEMDMTRIHFCLSGGATASAIIRQLGEGTWSVKEEIVPGVVTLVLEKQGMPLGLFTVKPGSYPWPASLLETLLPTVK